MVPLFLLCLYVLLCCPLAVFGWKFLFSIFIVYGVQQGMANSWFFQVSQPLSLTHSTTHPTTHSTTHSLRIFLCAHLNVCRPTLTDRLVITTSKTSRRYVDKTDTVHQTG